MMLTDFTKRIKIRYKITFISTLIFGVLSQGMGLFNKYSFHDDVTHLFGVGATYSSGRWMLDILSQWEIALFGDGHFSMPVMNGFSAITFIAVAACFMVAMLDIKSQVLCAFVGGIMVVFPVVTGIFGYMFTLPYYVLAMLVGVMGAYCFCRMRTWRKAIGIVLMGVSVGIYQAFVPVTLCTLLFYVISELEKGDDEPRQAAKKIVAAGLSAATFMVIYFGLNKILLTKNNVQLSSYQGINRMGTESLSEYTARVIHAYREFFVPTAGTKYYMYQSNIRNVYTIVVLSGIAMALLAVAKAFKKSRANACMLGGVLLLVPLACNFIFVIASPSDVHALMVYGQVMPFILFACLLDRLTFKTRKIERMIKGGLAIMLILLNIMYCRFDNECYLKAEFTQQKAISYFTTLITQIKCTDGYMDEMPVSFINENISDLSIYEMANLSHIQIAPYWGMNDYVNDYVWIEFMKKWCGYSPNIIDGADVMDNEEVKGMPSYPDQGSIKVIENRVVVKF